MSFKDDEIFIWLVQIVNALIIFNTHGKFYVDIVTLLFTFYLGTYADIDISSIFADLILPLF